MKCDRRWYNDGRLEREWQQHRDRYKAPEHVAAYWRQRMAETFGMTLAEAEARFDIEVTGEHGQWQTSFTPKGCKLRITLPEAP